MPFSSILESNPWIARLLAIRANSVLAYGLMTALVALATLLRWMFGPDTGLPTITYFPAVTVAALLGGAGPGVVAVVASSVLAWWLFMPEYTWSAGDPNVLFFLFFALMAGLIVGVVVLLHKAVDRLIEQERNVRTLIESMPAGIVVVDESGRIKLANPTASKLFGYDVRELIGRNVDGLVPSRLADGHVAFRSAYMRNPEARPMGLGRDLSGVHRDGREIPLEIGLAPLIRGGEQSFLATLVDISERHAAGERQRLLTRELQHRTQNLCAVIQSIASRSLVDGKTMPEAKAELLGRLHALATAIRALSDASWEGAPLADLIGREMSAFSANITVAGCDVVLNPQAVQHFALAIHELATNAIKHGALSSPHGAIAVKGEIVRDSGVDSLVWTWEESGGPPPVEPSRTGFGSTILRDAARMFGGEVSIEYRPAGLRYTYRIALAEVAANPHRPIPAFAHGADV